MAATGVWWPTEAFVADAARRVGLVGRIRVFADATLPPAWGAKYVGLVDGRHDIALKQSHTEHWVVICVCHELIHVAQAQRMGQESFQAWVSAEVRRVGNYLDGAHEVEAYTRGTALALEFLPPGSRLTYRQSGG
jgi:hypothetical protein